MNFDFFIDESCHLEHDDCKVMCIGYIKVPKDNVEKEKLTLKEIKRQYGIPYEIKWNTVSRTKLDMYKRLIDYFFVSSLEFRCILIKYKDRLDNNAFNDGKHDNFYYKMIYSLLSNQYVNPPQGNNYRVYLDIKDTRGRDKLRKINEVFTNRHYGVSPFVYFQHIRSNESVFIQLADIFIGAVTYKARKVLGEELTSPIKSDLVSYIEKKSGYTINESSEPWEAKFNIFDHQPRKRDE